ncbi:hypothetical protein MLD38_023372 [Melastoma candidum]|uniref:Uncharacterized protein n=1 Tax=Melastoma candidum TaxID=119954 RepID=A0ACB9QP45_9MYRT|nr:hypothetical protein MLD38_023372 [Melastoma candidum]
MPNLHLISLDDFSASQPRDKDSTRIVTEEVNILKTTDVLELALTSEKATIDEETKEMISWMECKWSLHTARQRLVKKKKYCQFFTRFGKCNKDDGKCPYIHDPSKIAVCTKFLNDLCSKKDCKLTHKIIPEGMPDCSFFLQGLCANKNCPYRHVNVNPKAPTCEAFLRGYCMDGNECRKKHSYVCPVFGATGNCPQGSKCKFHHPKVPNMGKKRKKSREKMNGRDRYFGNMSRTTLEPGASIMEKPLPVTHGETLDLPDFISLGSSDDEAGDGGGRGDGTSDPLDLPCGDIDGLIKPLGVRKLDLTTS